MYPPQRECHRLVEAGWPGAFFARSARSEKFFPTTYCRLFVGGILPRGRKEEKASKMKQSDQGESNLPRGLSQPARRALVGAGYLRLEQLTEISEDEVKRLHGMGPKAIDLLRSALATLGLSFAEKKKG
jgi:hypothetical protein